MRAYFKNYTFENFFKHLNDQKSENVSSRFSRTFEANASEYLENHENVSSLLHAW